MATPSLVRYEQNEATRFYLCRRCKTHLALHQELLYKYVNSKHGLFNNVVNVTLGENYAVVSGQIAAAAFCISCNTNFGAKFIALRIETGAIKAGRFMIDMKELLLWNGNQVVYADTEEPVENA